MNFQMFAYSFDVDSI